MRYHQLTHWEREIIAVMRVDSPGVYLMSYTPFDVQSCRDHRAQALGWWVVTALKSLARIFVDNLWEQFLKNGKSCDIPQLAFCLRMEGGKMRSISGDFRG